MAVGFLQRFAATIAFVESTDITDEEKNRLCPPVVFSGDAAVDAARVPRDPGPAHARAVERHVEAEPGRRRCRPQRGHARARPVKTPGLAVPVE